MSQRWLRILAAIVAFAVVVFIGIVAGGKFTAESTNSWALITAIALSLGAPYWFDLLSKIVSVRGAGRKPPPA